MEQIDGNTSLVEESHLSPSETHGIEKGGLDAILAVCAQIEQSQ